MIYHNSMEYKDIDIDIKDKKKNKKKKGLDCFRVIGLYALYIFFLCLIFIGFGLALLIISLIHIVSEFKIFYLLNIVAIIIPIALISMRCLRGSDEVCAIRVLVLIFSKYLFDGICYFFYFYETINTFAPLILLIFSDVFLLPCIYIAANDLSCCSDNCWLKI